MGLGTSLLQGRRSFFRVSLALNGEIRVRDVPSQSFTQEDLDAGECVFVHSSAPASDGTGFVFVWSFGGMSLKPEMFQVVVRESSSLISLGDPPSVPAVRPHSQTEAGGCL